MSDAAGWYGKLPALGDFASRRLEPEWIAAWDTWLATGLAALRDGAPDTWLADYLASPAWRFALMPGALDDALRVGVLVPSVDSVGRYFPLVVASPPLPTPRDLAAARALWQWAGALEDQAIDALQLDWSADAFDDALRHTGLPAPFEADQATDDRSFDNSLARVCGALAWQGLQGCSLWFRAADLAAPRQVRGLPSDADFDALFRKPV